MDNNIVNQPLLSTNDSDQTPPNHSLRRSDHSSSFIADAADIPKITGIKEFYVQFVVESRKLWYLAGPAIFTSLCQYSLGAITQTFAGQVGTLDLAAFSVENSVIAGFSFGTLLGMGSALETLCGQAYGAGQISMLGVYMQRSWVILNSTAFLLMFLYIFAARILRLIGQTEDISREAGKVAVWMIPQLYAYAIYFPISKFLQSQSKIMVMAYIAGVALVLHTILSWLFMMKLGWGLAAGTAVLDFSWWFIVGAQMIYIFMGYCGEAWSGFSWRAFENLWGFVKLSVASAVMLCLETWYFMALILFAGYLKNAEIAVDALSVCMNLVGWTIMAAIGCNSAISVRVSNELGARHPRTAKFSVVVVVISSFLIGLFISIILIIFRKQYPAVFSSSEEVQKVVYSLTPLLAACIVINNIQPALSGVAIGAGWQAIVAYVNIGCYYIFGIPLGLTLGYILNMGVTGIWIGMLTGTVVQTLVLFLIVYRTNWNKESSIAGERIREWGGESKDDKITDLIRKAPTVPSAKAWTIATESILLRGKAIKEIPVTPMKTPIGAAAAAACPGFGALQLTVIEYKTQRKERWSVLGLIKMRAVDQESSWLDSVSSRRKAIMQSDQVVWQVIRHNHCSFMSKIETAIFCRNPYNVTGTCNRSSCPLANSRYATVRDHDGVFYLYMKTAERAHMPNKLWERVKLPRNYEKALEIIDKHLMYWPKFLVHKTKQRLTKLTQMRIRMRKLALKTREKIMTIPKKVETRDRRRMEKAEKAAMVDKSIENELLKRLEKGVYGDIYSHVKEYNKLPDDIEVKDVDIEHEEDDEVEIEYVEGYEELEEEDDMEDFGGLAIGQGAADDDNDGSDEDDELIVAMNRKRERKDSAFGGKRLDSHGPNVKSKKKSRVLVEVEHDLTDERQISHHVRSHRNLVR
ncbi:protein DETOXIFICATION 30-like [Daucus carota subsp. sativus]